MSKITYWLIEEPKRNDECEWACCPNVDYIKCDHILRSEEKGKCECNINQCPIFYKKELKNVLE